MVMSIISPVSDRAIVRAAHGVHQVRDDRRRRAAELEGTAPAREPNRQAVAQSMSRQTPEPAGPSKQYWWAIYHITGTPAKLLGHVEAPDEESALKQAIEEFGITNPQLQKRLLAQRRP
jgi:hypothetical protein